MKRKGRRREGIRIRRRSCCRSCCKEVTQQHNRDYIRRNKPRGKQLNCLTMSSLLASVVTTFILLTCSTITTNTNPGKLIEAAVVRPTIFKSDPNSPETAQLQPPQQAISNSQLNPLAGKLLFSIALRVRVRVGVGVGVKGGGRKCFIDCSVCMWALPFLCHYLYC